MKIIKVAKPNSQTTFFDENDNILNQGDYIEVFGGLFGLSDSGILNKLEVYPLTDHRVEISDDLIQEYCPEGGCEAVTVRIYLVDAETFGGSKKGQLLRQLEKEKPWLLEEMPKWDPNEGQSMVEGWGVKWGNIVKCLYVHKGGHGGWKGEVP
jgi:hypothetical protein